MLKSVPGTCTCTVVYNIVGSMDCRHGFILLLLAICSLLNRVLILLGVCGLNGNEYFLIVTDTCAGNSPAARKCFIL